MFLIAKATRSKSFALQNRILWGFHLASSACVLAAVSPFNVTASIERHAIPAQLLSAAAAAQSTLTTYVSATVLVILVIHALLTPVRCRPG